MILAFGAHGVGEEVGVSEADAFGERSRCCPAEAGGFADVEKFARCAVGFGCVPADNALISDRLRHEFGKSFDGDFFARADIDGFVAGVVIHEEYAELGKVIDIKKFAQWAAVAPTYYLGKSLLLGFVETADECRKDVRVGRMIVVVRAVKIGGHDGDVVRRVLAVKVFAVFQPRNLGKRVCLVGLFEFGCEQTGFGHGLRSHTGVDAR